MDLIVRNAKARGYDGLVDIGIEGEKIAEVAPKIGGSAKKEIDAGGMLVAPTFVECHIHLDKALISETVRDNVSGTLMEAIEIIWERKRNYDVKEVAERAGRVMEMLVSKGVTQIRTHVDVDTIGGLRPLEGVRKAAEAHKDICDVQIVAFPQEGIVQDPGTEELMWQAMDKGACVVGGMPYNEMTYDDSKEHIDICFEIAKKFDADIDMHTDETDDPMARTLQYLAAKAIKEKWFGRVTADHTTASAGYDPAYASKLASMLKKAEMNIETNPSTNLMLQGRFDQQPIRRGLTRVKDWMDAGINVAYGQDCVKDTFLPTFGQGDPLEVGMVCAHALHFSMPHQVEWVFDMATVNAAKVMRLENYGLAPGCVASLNVIDAPTVQEAFRTQPDRRYVIFKGRVVAETRTEVKVHRA